MVPGRERTRCRASAYTPCLNRGPLCLWSDSDRAALKMLKTHCVWTHSLTLAALGTGWRLAILSCLSVSLISASKMSKKAKTFNDYCTNVLQNSGFRRVKVRIHSPCEWNLTSPQPGPEYAVPVEWFYAPPSGSNCVECLSYFAHFWATLLQSLRSDHKILNPETALEPSKWSCYNRSTGTADSAPTPLKHSPCEVILLGAESFECLSSRAHFCWFVSNVSAPVLRLRLRLKLRLSIIMMMTIIIIRCRFLRMSQLPCSFLLIRVECLSSRAHFLCRCRFLRTSQLPCSFLLICVECLSSRAQAQAEAQALQYLIVPYSTLY